MSRRAVVDAPAGRCAR